MIPADEALERLRAGNRRFASGELRLDGGKIPARRAEVATGQEPFATILGCSDSRVPAELVFDQGIGDLFVVRVAGNIAAPSQVGSIEFAALKFHTRLVVVLGHSRCGAVEATLDQVRGPDAGQSPNLQSIVDRVRPAVEGLVAAEPADGDRDALVARAVQANVRAAVTELRQASPTLERLIREQGVRVVGAEYSLDTGRVDFFDDT